MSEIMQDIERIEEKLVARIHELQGAVVELETLQRLADRLGISVDDASDSVAAARPRARTGQGSAGTGGRLSRRGAQHAPGGRVTRRDRVLTLVRDHPGISVPELVEAMDVNRTSLYPVVRQLISDGLLHKDGKGLIPRSS